MTPPPPFRKSRAVHGKLGVADQQTSGLVQMLAMIHLCLYLIEQK